MDLSWPKGHSANGGVLKDIYLNTEYILKYLSVCRITDSLRTWALLLQSIR